MNGDYLSAYRRKINVGGSAFCIYCNKTLVYGNTGKNDLLKHATKSTEHLSNKKNYLSTTLLLLHWRKPTSDSCNEISTCPPLARECTMPYGVVENVHTTATCPSLKGKRTPRVRLSVFQIVYIILKPLFYLLLPKIHYRCQSYLN